VTHDDPTGRLVVTWLTSDHLDPGMLVRLVADVAGIDADGIRLVRACRSCGSDQHGKPQIVMPFGEPRLHLSYSRSGGRAVVAVTETGPVGIDLEAVRTSEHDVAAWVRTESLVKATGHGITTDPHLIDDAPVWTGDLAAPDGFVAAVTVLTDAPPQIISESAAPEG